MIGVHRCITHGLQKTKLKQRQINKRSRHAFAFGSSSAKGVNTIAVRAATQATRLATRSRAGHRGGQVLTRVRLAHLCLALLKAREHVMGQDHRLELNLRLGHVAVFSREHVHL